MFDLPKLVIQTTMLFTYLDKGFPIPVIVFYTVLLLVNWGISLYRFVRHTQDKQLVLSRLFYMYAASPLYCCSCGSAVTFHACVCACG